jgi:histidinol dehydrogenase
VHTFLKPVEVIEYAEPGLKAIAAKINTFAVTEDLPAHGESVLSRFVVDPYDKASLDSQETKAGLQ